MSAPGRARDFVVMEKRTKKVILLCLILFFLIIIYFFYTSLYGTAGRDTALQTITVERGAPFSTVARRLGERGLIRSQKKFMFAAWLLGAYREIQAGEYAFSPSMTPLAIIRMLKSGAVREYVITVPEGYTVREIGALLEKKGLTRADEFRALALKGGIASSLGLPGPTAEGYLFPDTYILRKGMSAREIMAKMAGRFKEVYERELRAEAEERGMNAREVVTLASMIEKETSDPSERALISSVFHNRLRRGIKLQSDPTVIYAIKAFDGNIRKKDLDIRSPYNTYLHYGLPPGPIANPGLASMRSAIEPADTDYLYFVSRNDGTHYFSRTYREHQRAVRRFQLGRGQR